MEIAKLPPRRRKLVLRELYTSEWNRCADDPQYWLDKNAHPVSYVYTWDPHELYTCNICANDDASVNKYKLGFHLQHSHGLKFENAVLERSNFQLLPKIRPFTVKPYMPPIIKWWQESQLFAVEKSRDMMLTHLIIGLICWDCFFHTGKQWAIQSEDGKKTLDLMENRIKFVWDNMPQWMRRGKMQWSRSQTKAGYIRIPAMNSEVIGFPQGPDQVRYLHPTGIFVDEAAFQEQAGAAFSACKPAIQEGGKYCAISTPYPGFFQLVCEDRTTEAEARDTSNVVTE